MLRFVFTALVLTLTSISTFANPLAAQPKEWTFMVFLNGKNNLDKFGRMNINQMEKIGSTAKINVIVQWGSLEEGKTQRLYVTKDKDTNKVSSKVVEDMGSTDMGDYHAVTDFVKWSAANYPAQHYFLAVWDHGSGWHFNQEGQVYKDISWDDETGNHITTEQLATALEDSAKAIGQKIDIYGSDACLMGMVEIAQQMEEGVNVFVGSEELEPGDGWPYDSFLASWNKLPAGASAVDVSRTLVKEYGKYYQKKSVDITLSAFDLSYLKPLNQSIKSLVSSFKKLKANELKQVNQAVKESTRFAYEDYVDLGDFLSHVKALNLSALSQASINDASAATKNFIVANETINFPNATGAAIWIPEDTTTYERYASRYSKLKFDRETQWSTVARLIAEHALH